MRIGWVDFSKDERNKVLSVIEQLKEHGAVDELGLGIIRDAFADYFFPGTSTVQTRAKYFLIVPYILKEVCSEKHSNISRAVREIDDMEIKCRDILIKNSSDGVIGSLVPSKWVQRPPSNIYWNGLKKYGIITENVSIRDLLKHSYIQASIKNRKEDGGLKKESDDDDTDDNDAGDILSLNLIDISEIYSRDWRDGLTIELKPDEASFLRTKIIQNQGQSLLGYILRKDVPIEKYDSFKQLSVDLYDKVDKETAEMMKLANDFNDFVLMITTRFNMIVSQKKNALAISRWEEIEKHLSQVGKVDLNVIFWKLRIVNAGLKSFLRNVQTHALNEDIDSIDKLIISRETNIKTKERAKTLKAGTFPTGAWIGADIFDYRFRPAKRIVEDIMNAGVKNV